MLVSKLSCPKCKTVLRPAKPLPATKRVKCPKCANDFTAEEGNADRHTAKAAVEPVAKSQPAAAASKKKAAAPAAKLDEVEAVAKKPYEDDDDGPATYTIVEADRPKTQEDLDREEAEREERGDDDEKDKDKVDFVPDQSIKDLRGPAQIAVIRPSNMLILNGVIGFFGWAILFIILIIPVVFPVVDDEAVDKDAPGQSGLPIPDGLAALATQPQPAGAGLPGAQARVPSAAKAKEKKVSLYNVYVWDLSLLAFYPWFIFLAFLSPIFIGIAYACVMTYGAVQMQNLESRVWGIVASCMCMFPMATGGFVIVVSMIITLVVYGITEEAGTVGLCMIAFIALESLGCLGIGIFGLVTLMRQDVIDGFNYVPDA